MPSSRTVLPGPKTDQETFDKVARHLLRQRCKAISKVGRTPKLRIGCLRCAIGCLLPFRVLTRKLEDAGASIRLKPAERSPMERQLWARGYHNPVLLQALQLLHDDLALCDWVPGLLRVAELFGLDATVVRRRDRRATRALGRETGSLDLVGQLMFDQVLDNARRVGLPIRMAV